MPRIQEFESPIDKLQPNQAGAEGLGRGGNALRQAAEDVGRTAQIQTQTADVFARLARYRGSLGEELASSERITAHDFGQGLKSVGDVVERHDTLQDISTGAASLANAHNDLTNQWNTAVNQADINDHSVAQKFNQDNLEPFLEKWQAGFHTEEGQKWALSQADAMREHFFTKQSADMMTRQGDAAIVNFNTTVNGLSQTTREDPTSMGHSMDMLKATVDGLVQNTGLSADAASKLRTETLMNGQKQIAVAAVQGMAEKNPQAAEAAVNSGQFSPWLNDQEVRSSLGFIKAQQEAQKRDAREARILANQEREMTWEANGAKLLGLAKVGPNNSITLPQDFNKTVIAMAGQGQLKWTTAKELVDWAERKDAPHPNESTPGLVNSLLQRASLPDNDPQKISSPSQLLPLVDRPDGPNLAKTDYEFIQKEMLAPDPISKDPLVKKQMSNAYDVINGLGNTGNNGLVDATNSAVKQAQSQFYVDTLRQLQAIKAAGQDTRPYLDPNSQQYLFSPDRIKQYVPSKEEVASHYFQGIKPVTPEGRPELPDIRLLFAKPPAPEEK